MSLRLGTRFGSKFREVPASVRVPTRAKARNPRRPRRVTPDHPAVTRSSRVVGAQARGPAVTYTIGELVTEAYAHASRVTSDPAIEAILATRLMAAWLARSTLSSTRPASMLRDPASISAGAEARRQSSDGFRRSRPVRAAVEGSRFASVGAHRAVA
jgi:hypothetical protein